MVSIFRIHKKTALMTIDKEILIENCKFLCKHKKAWTLNKVLINIKLKKVTKI